MLSRVWIWEPWIWEYYVRKFSWGDMAHEKISIYSRKDPMADQTPLGEPISVLLKLLTGVWMKGLLTGAEVVTQSRKPITTVITITRKPIPKGVIPHESCNPEAFCKIFPQDLSETQLASLLPQNFFPPRKLKRSLRDFLCLCFPRLNILFSFWISWASSCFLKGIH